MVSLEKKSKSGGNFVKLLENDIRKRSKFLSFKKWGQKSFWALKMGLLINYLKFLVFLLGQNEI